LVKTLCSPLSFRFQFPIFIREDKVGSYDLMWPIEGCRWN
jgi:hypothetical protein